MSSPLPIPIADIPSRLGATLGAIFIGATIAAVFVRNLGLDAMLTPRFRFYGITILQTVVYYKQNPNDPWLFRYAVAFLWIFDTLHVALSTHALYFYLIESFGNYLSLFGMIWSFPLQLLFNMLIVSGVQALYAVRIWKLGRHFHMVLPRFIFLAVVATLGTGTYVIYDTLYGRFDYQDFSTIAGADFVIAGLSFIPRSMNVLMQLIKYYQHNFETNAARSDIRAGDEYIAWPNTLIFVAIDFILPKLYINSLLAMLNSRQSSMWSTTKGHHVDQKIIRFAPPRAAGSGMADSGQTVRAVLSGTTAGLPETSFEDVTIPGLSMTEADMVQTNITLPLPITEGSLSSSIGDMTFA
ncbi:hypothetical protein ARMSODRAFT_1021242 [Armillaria solidipes]|uniref:DUF6534 domain-containing protein n=1 Tax=Armillaria solidipes TaxID=1076256 RepID=A0A2H3BD39_9AGAR|nr:hypothetical protein ARMSODRAFT_1021242 [Armillaria solidipes]